MDEQLHGHQVWNYGYKSHVAFPSLFVFVFLFRDVISVRRRTGANTNSVVFWDVTQRTLVKHRRFGTTYRFHLQGSRVQEESRVAKGGILVNLAAGAV